MAQTTNSNNKLTNLELSIQISLSGLSFCVLSKASNTVLTLKEFLFDKKLNPLEVLDRLKILFKTDTHLQQNFDTVNIIHENELSTLVPNSFFNEDCLADYLKFNSKILKSDFITFDTIKFNDSTNVYVPYVNINNFIYEKFGSFTYKHVSTVLIENIFHADKDSDIPKIYAHVNTNHFELIIIEKGRLLLYNTFEYSTEEDFIYYVLFTAEQLQLDPEIFHLVFIGNVEKDDNLYNISYKYIRHVSFGKRNDTFQYQDQPKTEYSNYTLIKSL